MEPLTGVELIERTLFVIAMVVLFATASLGSVWLANKAVSGKRNVQNDLGSSSSLSGSLMVAWKALAEIANRTRFAAPALSILAVIAIFVLAHPERVVRWIARLIEIQ